MNHCPKAIIFLFNSISFYLRFASSLFKWVFVFLTWCRLGSRCERMQCHVCQSLIGTNCVCRCVWQRSILNHGPLYSVRFTRSISSLPRSSPLADPFIIIMSRSGAMAQLPTSLSLFFSLQSSMPLYVWRPSIVSWSPFFSIWSRVRPLL